jgi:parallel beta-helix repeat protein
VNVTLAAPPPPPGGDWIFCATEGGFCTFTGTQQVRYGANGAYFYKTLSDGTACTNSVFGDPIYGVAKDCEISAGASIDEWMFCAGENQTCAFTGTREVRYGADGSYFYKTLFDGTPCTNGVFGDPIFGTAKQCHIKTTAPPSSSYGSRPTITCPAGAVDIWPGQSIPLIVNSHTGSTTFCLRAGVHSLTSAIRPKTGNTFVGEYGAILDGTDWTTTDDTQAAFRAHDEDIDYVTIRNLVIRNMPQYGIHSAYALNSISDRWSDHWTIEYNEIASNKYGLLFGPDFIIRNNYIHHNVGTSGSTAQRGGGYLGLYASNTSFDSNEIAWNGPEQKVFAAANMAFRNNFVHHNLGDGIWYDSFNTGALVEDNRVEDNGRNGIFYEASDGVTIRNNTLRRNDAGDAVLISMSQNAQIYNNSLEANFGAIQYFLNCASLSEGYDLQNNAAYDNTVVIGTQSNTYANGFSYTFASCAAAQVEPYLNGSKNLTFFRNAYRVPSLSDTEYFIWPSYTDWNAWQALGHDLEGSMAE